MKIEYFKLSEFDARDADGKKIPGTGGQMRACTIEKCDKLREAYGKPLIVASGIRTPERNKQVGGAKNSSHLLGYAVDWEDIASYRKDGKAWLLIGDIGDNNGSRTHYEVIAVEEPEIDGKISTLSVKPAWRLRFHYADGAHDCEAMAIDTASNAILLINKHAPLAIHSLALDPPRHTAEVATAIQLGALESIPQPDADERLARFPAARFGGSPTGMDIDASGRLAVVLTYRDAWLFERRAGMSWVEAFGKPLQRLPLPPLPQAEAIGFSADSRYFLIGSENLPAPLLRVDLSTEGGSAEH